MAVFALLPYFMYMLYPFFFFFFDFCLSPFLLALLVLGYFKMKGNPFFTQERPGWHEKISLRWMCGIQGMFTLKQTGIFSGLRFGLC